MNKRQAVAKATEGTYCFAMEEVSGYSEKQPQSLSLNWLGFLLATQFPFEALSGSAPDAKKQASQLPRAGW